MIRVVAVREGERQSEGKFSGFKIYGACCANFLSLFQLLLVALTSNSTQHAAERRETGLGHKKRSDIVYPSIPNELLKN
jgi:hypothetical protein